MTEISKSGGGEISKPGGRQNRGREISHTLYIHKGGGIEERDAACVIIPL